MRYTEKINRLAKILQSALYAPVYTKSGKLFDAELNELTETDYRALNSPPILPIQALQAGL